MTLGGEKVNPTAKVRNELKDRPLSFSLCPLVLLLTLQMLSLYSSCDNAQCIDVEDLSLKVVLVCFVTNL
jgi:hypothetical protein